MFENRIGYMVSEEDLEEMREAYYDKRGTLIPAITGCSDTEKKRILRKKEHRLKRLTERADKCLELLRKAKRE